MKILNHPNIVKLHEVIDDPESKEVNMIFDFIENDSVQKLIDRQEGK